MRDFEGQGNHFRMRKREKGIPGIRGNRPQTAMFKVKRLGNRVILDKFMNCCGEPVTSEVALGQTAIICLWSVAEGDSWHLCLLLEPWSPSEQCCAGKSRGANRSLSADNFLRHSCCCTSVTVQHLAFLLLHKVSFSF